MPLTPDNSYSTLANIQTKVRRLTRSPSPSQISDNELTNYINNFVLYDFPEQLRLFNLRTTVTFYTQPYIDTYKTTTTNTNDPLYNFENKYTTIHPPCFIAGYASFFSQSREQFYGVYPLVNTIQSTGLTGDGVTTFFTGTITPAPLLMGNVTITSIDALNQGICVVDKIVYDPLTDYPDTIGNLVNQNGTTVLGTIDYVTGAFSIDFTIPPAFGAPIMSQTVPVIVAQPQACLFYDGSFIIRPVPDKCYRVDLEAYKRPDQLLLANSMPELSEWWQYIAYGASIKILQDRMDLDTVNMIMPEFKMQERLIIRRTIVQQTNERSASIYTEQTSQNYGNGWGFGGGQY